MENKLNNKIKHFCRIGYQSFIYIARNMMNININCVIFLFGKGSLDLNFERNETEEV